MRRSQINTAPYNPRIISDQAKKKLGKGIDEWGLVEPLVWNKRTGVLVSGHQRISKLDSLEGDNDYVLDFSVVDVDEKRERELNVLLNNRNLQGDYDTDLLASLLNDSTGFDYNAAGLTINDLNILGVSSMPLDESEAPEIEDAKEKFQKGLEHTRDERADYEKKNAKDDPEFFITTIFRDRATKERFLEKHNLDESTKYLSAEALDALIFKCKPIKGEVTLALHVTPEVLEIWEETVKEAAPGLGYGPEYPNRDGRMFELIIADFRAGH